MQALRNAHAAGDTAAATRLAQMAREAKRSGEMAGRVEAARSGALTVAPEQTAAADAAALAQMQPAPSMAGDIAASGGSGLLRGAASLADLPGAVFGVGAGIATRALEAAGVPSEYAQAARDALSGGPLGSGRAGQDAMGLLSMGASEYEPQTTAGEYAQTVGEFVPGAMLGGPTVGNALRYGVIPGLVSEAAGQATEGTALEPWARAAGAIGASLLASRPGAFVGDDEATRMANVVREAGVRNVTQGQASGSQPLMRMEGMLQATDEQLDDFTAATLRMLGSDAKTATPANLMQIERRLVSQMDDAVRGIDIAPTPTQATEAARVAAQYVERVPSGQLTPRVRGIAREIEALAKAGKTVPLSRLKQWRSDVGNLTVSPDAATREAAHNLRGLLDSMTDNALIAAGRDSDIASLAQAREAYRNYIGIRDAASRAGAEGGVLSPTAVNQSMIRAQGRDSYATGRSTPMTDFTRSAAAVLRPAPATSPGGVRSFAEALPIALASLGGAAGLAGGGPVGAALGGIAGALAPSVGQATMRSGPVQAMLRDPTGTLARASRILPGLLAQ